MRKWKQQIHAQHTESATNRSHAQSDDQAAHNTAQHNIRRLKATITNQQANLLSIASQKPHEVFTNRIFFFASTSGWVRSKSAEGTVWFACGVDSLARCSEVMPVRKNNAHVVVS
jgi:hypothetical protein